MLISLPIIFAVLLYLSPVFAKNLSFGERLMKFLFLGGVIFFSGAVFVSMIDIFFPISFIAPPFMLIYGYKAVSHES